MATKRGEFIFFILCTLLALAALIYLFVAGDMLSSDSNKFILGILVFLVLAVAVYLYLHFFHHSTQIKKAFQSISVILSTESIDVLKEKYKELYQIYLNLSEKQKQNYYHKLMEIREEIETQLKASKKIEELLHKVQSASLEEKQRLYDEFHELFLKLSAQTQQHYYSSLVHIKDQLERGN